MERLTRWLVKKYLPGHRLIGTLDLHVVRGLLKECAPNYHVHRDPSKKVRNANEQGS